MLQDFLNSCVITYIVNILIYSWTKAEHITRVHVVLTKVLDNNLYVKRMYVKYEFHQSAVKFQGYFIDEKGVETDNHLTP